MSYRCSDIAGLADAQPDNGIALVTGGAGFIGSNLVARLLELGYTVNVLDDLSTGDAGWVSFCPEATAVLGQVQLAAWQCCI